MLCLLLRRANEVNTSFWFNKYQKFRTGICTVQAAQSGTYSLSFTSAMWMRFLLKKGGAKFWLTKQALIACRLHRQCGWDSCWRREGQSSDKQNKKIQNFIKQTAINWRALRVHFQRKHNQLIKESKEKELGFHCIENFSGSGNKQKARSANFRCRQLLTK